MANLAQFYEYKKQLAMLILNDPECVDLISNGTYTGRLPAASLLEQVLSDGRYVPGQVHLYDYIPDVMSDSRVHVTIEIEDDRAYTPAVAGYTIVIIIMVPTDLMNMYGNIRRDKLAARIDTLINGSTTFGFGRLERRAGSVNIPAPKVRSRTLRFFVKDWNMRDKELGNH